MIDNRTIEAEAPRVSRSRSRRGLAWGTGLVLLAVAGGATAVATGVVTLPFLPHQAPAQAAAAPAATPVSVAVVEQRETPIWTDFSGRLEAVDRVEIRPRVAGAIVAVHFREGALVKQGDPLFTIDPAPFAAEVDRYEAQVAVAESQLVFAVKERVRAEQLVTTSALPQRDVDQRINTFRAAEANLRAAKAALATNRLNLGWTEVRAPISGRVGRIEVTQGNLVGAGPAAPVLTTLVSVSPIYASFEADEQTVSRALAALPASADVIGDIGRIPVRMGVSGTEGTPLQGKLQLIDNQVDGRSGTVRVRAVFDNADGRLMPGQFARLRLGQPKNEPAMAIDERAIGTDQDRRFVMVVGADNKVAYRDVRLGAIVDGLRIVTEGLHPGEHIVVNGLQRVRPGALVAPKMVEMQTPQTAVASR
jgi:multidrug efflux system membrane fusion protein